MLPPSFHTHENVERIKYAQLAATVLAVLVCGYLVI